MCGRFTLGISLEELMLRYMLEDIPDYIDYKPHYNIAPTQQIMAVIHDGSQRRRAGTLRWGLVPHWAKDLSIGSRMINARSETVLDKPAFRESFLRKRCLIPADGFYEWLKEENGTKTPYRIIPRTGLFSFAGLYDTWINPEGQRISTCTILTTSPNTLMSRIHDRMPVILPPGKEQLWLDRTVQQPAELLPLLCPYPEEEMEAYPVSRAVNRVANDSVELTHPLA
ncbi:SOS response-associated peptidase [Paenibacillus urinalis]|uniref:Abasic site processing protein n=1 Tax=Paenibacillus urinalis TaxID=521520 RepID=A0AAX3MVD3_9BACL|nr:SOS response-associated peptidase [Paenibacillus urinalis]WDH81416.1 SOS response-associated peptidase [Paenibacillus urinalis]